MFCRLFFAMYFGQRSILCRSFQAISWYPIDLDLIFVLLSIAFSESSIEHEGSIEAIG